MNAREHQGACPNADCHLYRHDIPARDLRHRVLRFGVNPPERRGRMTTLKVVPGNGNRGRFIQTMSGKSGPVKRRKGAIG